MVRLSVDEMYDRIGKPGKGYDLEEGKRIAKRLEELGVDAINVSSACYDTYNYWLEPTSFEPGWRAYLAKAIKETVNIPICAANFMRSPNRLKGSLKMEFRISLVLPAVSSATPTGSKRLKMVTPRI